MTARAEAQSLIEELDATLDRTSSPQHLSILRDVTDLFVNGSDTFAEDHVAVFDDVIVRLIDKADRPALIELSGRLAAISNAPVNVIDRLARHEDIAISGPILQKSDAVKDQTLADVAGTKGERHLSAIASRALIRESVTDILASRCNAETARKLAENKGASLSEIGFVKLINRFKTDRALAASIESRSDLPPELQPFLQLALS
jgi:uncharacterized protein (DUF2336 family)